MPKRHLFVPTAARFVSVEDGTVRDLDGQQLGRVACEKGAWLFSLGAMNSTAGEDYATQTAAVAGLLAHPSCPVPGPNRYDRPA